MEENNRNDLNNQTTSFPSENKFNLNNGVQTNQNDNNTIQQQVTNNSNNNGNKPIIIILVLCALFSIIFIFLFAFVYLNLKKMGVKTENKSTTTNSVNQNDFITNNKTTSSITSTTTQNKTNYLDNSVAAQVYEDIMGKTSDINELYPAGTGLSKDYLMDLYSNKKVVLDTYFTYENKMDIVISRLFKEDKVILTEGSNSYNLSFKADDLIDVYRNYFGKDKHLYIKEFVSELYGNCNIGDEIYRCELKSFSSSNTTSKEFITIYDDYKIENNKLYIYEYAIYSTNNKYYLSYSQDKGFSNEISKLSGKSNEDLKNYKSDLLKYKHTFNKNSDGSFYWYSTEPVK